MLAADPLLGFPEAIESNTHGSNENVPSYRFFPFSTPPYLFFSISSAPWQPKGQFFLTASLGYYFYNQEQLLMSPLAPTRASDIFNWRAVFQLLKLGGGKESQNTTVTAKQEWGWHLFSVQVLKG